MDGRTGTGRTGGVTSLDEVRRREPLTVALVGSSCWVADALARALVAGGDRVLRLAGPGGPHGAPDGGLHDVDGGPAPSGADVVVHLAAGPQEASLRGRSEPALQTLAALHQARVDSARLVVASLPGNAAHLAADEALADGFRSAHAVQTLLVQLAEVYGPGMPPARTAPLARMLDQARTDRVVVVEAGDEDEHAVCFVDDAVAGLLALVREGSGGPFRLAPARGVRTLDLARAVAEATGSTCRVREPRRLRVAPVGRPSTATGDDRPAPPGWGCRVELTEGLARCVAAASVPATGPAGSLVGERVGVVDLREPALALGGDVA